MPLSQTERNVIEETLRTWGHNHSQPKTPIMVLSNDHVTPRDIATAMDDDNSRIKQHIFEMIENYVNAGYASLEDIMNDFSSAL